MTYPTNGEFLMRGEAMRPLHYTPDLTRLARTDLPMSEAAAHMSPGVMTWHAPSDALIYRTPDGQMMRAVWEPIEDMPEPVTWSAPEPEQRPRWRRIFGAA